MPTSSLADAQVDTVMAQLRRAGGRVTTARRLVVGALLDATSHPTADDLAMAVHAERPEIHLSTVYRTLEALEALGLVEHTHVGHGPAVYHLGEPHQHLVCEQCGEVVDVDASLLDDLRAQLGTRFGFRLHVGHFALLGRCSRCDHR